MATHIQQLVSFLQRPAVRFSVGTIVVLGSALLGTTALLVCISIFAVGILTTTIVLWQRFSLIAKNNDFLGIPLALASDRQVLDLHWALAKSLRSISANFDPIYRDLALEQTRELNTQVGEIARGRIVFHDTERWRTAYESLLRSRGLHRYRSVAVIRTANYWQDEPGRKSVATNYIAQNEQGLCIERIAIVADHLWPSTERFPMEPLHTWLEEQHANGLSVRLIRLSELEREPDLVIDMGIYGIRALGIQEQDDRGRTVRFTLSFDFPEVLAAEGRWERLSLLAAPFAGVFPQPK